MKKLILVVVLGIYMLTFGWIPLLSQATPAEDDYFLGIKVHLLVQIVVLSFIFIVFFFYLWRHNKKLAKMPKEESEKEVEKEKALLQPVLINCPVCKNQISSAAVSCPSCGHPTAQPIQQQDKKAWSPGVAAVLSLIIPGTGQMYKGKVGAGLIWLILVGASYFVLLPAGIVFHLVCIFNAASGKK